MLSRIAVVVPAHNEQDLLPGCLAALRRCAAAVAPIEVEIIVVADSCTDATLTVALAGGARTVVINAHNVGRARAAGMDTALRRGTTGLWLATTDADSLPDPAWLRWHRTHAAAGADVLAGTVTVTDWTPWPATVRRIYESGYRAGMTAGRHRHVHGANLGCAADVYRRLGGFRPITHDEDRDLVGRARLAGMNVIHDRQLPVVTSARAVARAPDGFAAFLGAITV